MPDTNNPVIKWVALVAAFLFVLLAVWMDTHITSTRLQSDSVTRAELLLDSTWTQSQSRHNLTLQVASLIEALDRDSVIGGTPDADDMVRNYALTLVTDLGLDPTPVPKPSTDE